MSKTGVTGFKRIVNAGKYSLQGLKAAWINEAGADSDSDYDCHGDPAAAS